MSSGLPFSVPDSIASSLAYFTGRAWVVQRIDEWLATQQPRTFLLTGEPGSGKSTLAARLVQLSSGEVDARDTPHLGRQWLTYAHFCQAQVDSTLNPLRFIEALATHLAEHYQPFAQALAQAKSDHSISINVTNTINTVESGSQVNVVVIKAVNIGTVPLRLAFDQLVRQPLEQLCMPDFQEPIVILVDSLDEAWTFDQNENLVSLLGHVMTDLPVQVRFLLTSRPDPQVLNTIGSSSLDLIQNLPKEIDDVGKYIAGRLHTLLEPQRHDLIEQVITATNGNFLYAHYIVDELLSRFDQIVDLQHLVLPEGLEDIYRQFLHRQLQKDNTNWNEQYGPVLGTIAISRGAGLTRDQILGITQMRQNPQLTQGKLDSILQACAQYLASPGREGPFRIYHQSFREFLLADNEFPIYPDDIHQDIANYFLEEHEDWFYEKERYALQYLFTHLLEATQQTKQRRIHKQLIGKVITLLADFAFLEAKTALLGVDALLDDLRAALNLPLAGQPSPFDLPTFVPRLDQRSHLLRGWNPQQHPTFFAQQMYVWTVDWKLLTLVSQAESRLAQMGQPYLVLRWHVGSESPLLRTLRGHSQPVTKVAFTSNDQRAISASLDGMLIVWNLASGEPLHTLKGHSQSVTALVLTSDDQRAISASLDGTLIVWNLASGQSLHVLRGHSQSVTAVVLTSDDQRAVSASLDGTLIVWNLVSGQALHILSGHWAGVNGVALSSDNQWAISASWDGSLIMWDLDTGQPLKTLKWPGYNYLINNSYVQKSPFLSPLPAVTSVAHSSAVMTIALTSDNERAVSASWDGLLSVWDLASGQPVHFLNGHYNSSVMTIALTSDNERAVSASWDGLLSVWDLASGQRLEGIRSRSAGVISIALFSDNRRAIFASLEQLIVWDLTSGEPLQTLRGHSAAVTAIALTSDDQRAVSASADSTLIMWDLASGQPLHTPKGHSGTVCAMVLSRDEQRAVSASADSTLIVWDLASGQPLQTLGSASYMTGEVVTSVALTSDNRRVICMDNVGGFTIWDLTSGESFGPYIGHSSGGTAVVLTSDNQRAVTASLSQLLVWDLTSIERIHNLACGPAMVNSVVLTSDDQRAISASDDGILIVWDLANGQAQHILRGHSAGVTAVVLTSDNRNAVSASRDNKLIVWDLATGQALRTLVGHSSGVNAVTLTSDNQRAVSASIDNTLIVWDLVRGQAVQTLRGHIASVNAVKLTSDDRYVISTSFDNTLKVWELHGGQEVASLNVGAYATCIALMSDDTTLLVGDTIGNVYCLYLVEVRS